MNEQLVEPQLEAAEAREGQAVDLHLRLVMVRGGCHDHKDLGRRAALGFLQRPGNCVLQVVLQCLHHEPDAPPPPKLPPPPPKLRPPPRLELESMIISVSRSRNQASCGCAMLSQSRKISASPPSTSCSGVSGWSPAGGRGRG